MGLLTSSDLRPRFTAWSQSIKFSSAPESMTASSSVAVWCVTLTFVKMRKTGPETMAWLTTLDLLAGQVATRWPISPQ